MSKAIPAMSTFITSRILIRNSKIMPFPTPRLLSQANSLFTSSDSFRRVSLNVKPVYNSIFKQHPLTILNFSRPQLLEDLKEKEISQESIEHFRASLFDRNAAGKAVNNSFYTWLADPLSKAPSLPALQKFLANYMVGRLRTRRNVSDALSATYDSETQPSRGVKGEDALKKWSHVMQEGQRIFQEIAIDETPFESDSHLIRMVDCFNALFESLNLSKIQIHDLWTHPDVLPETRLLRTWQDSVYTHSKDRVSPIIASALQENNASKMLEYLYVALYRWFGKGLNDEQKKTFERYFSDHLNLERIRQHISTPMRKDEEGVEDKHGRITREVAKSCIQTHTDALKATQVLTGYHEATGRYWEAIYKVVVPPKHRIIMSEDERLSTMDETQYFGIQHTYLKTNRTAALLGDFQSQSTLYIGSPLGLFDKIPSAKTTVIEDEKPIANQLKVSYPHHDILLTDPTEFTASKDFDLAVIFFFHRYSHSEQLKMLYQTYHSLDSGGQLLLEMGTPEQYLPLYDAFYAALLQFGWGNRWFFERSYQDSNTVLELTGRAGFQITHCETDPYFVTMSGGEKGVENYIRCYFVPQLKGLTEPQIAQVIQMTESYLAKNGFMIPTPDGKIAWRLPLHKFRVLGSKV